MHTGRITRPTAIKENGNNYLLLYSDETTLEEAAKIALTLGATQYVVIPNYKTRITEYKASDFIFISVAEDGAGYGYKKVYYARTITSTSPFNSGYVKEHLDISGVRFPRYPTTDILKGGAGNHE